MKRIIAFVCVIICAFSLVACGGKTEKEPEVKVEMNLPVIYASMEESLPEMTQYGENKMLNAYGIKPEMYEEAYVYVSSDGLLADEVWLLKAADSESMERLEQLAKNRIQAKDDESVTYSPEQNKVVKKAQIIIRGDYLFMIVAAEVDALVQIVNAI